jgi:predicted transcriptional regulator
VTKKEYKALLIRLEPELYAAFSHLAALERRSNSNLAEVVIANYVKAQTDKKSAEFAKDNPQTTLETEAGNQNSPTETQSKIKTKRPTTARAKTKP